MYKWKPISLDEVKSYPLKERFSKFNIESFGKAWKPGQSMKHWLQSLPRVLAGNDFLEVADRIVNTAYSGKTIILAMGAHSVDEWF